MMNILWDFDGTIFDTYPAYTRIFQKFTLHDVSVKEVQSHLKVSFTHAIQHFQLSKEQEEQLRKECRSISPSEVFPFPFVEEVLKASNTNVIMTHKERKEVEEILAFHGMAKYFSGMVTGDDGFPRKPDASSYRYLHERHSLHLSIGDRELDVIPAKEIGLKTCLFQNRVGKADYYLDSFEDFFKIVNL
jgi:phosphoglycolate phosphatase-like HAD superfamily hydrolase